MRAPGWAVPGPRWFGPALMLAGALALSAAYLDPRGDKGDFELGLLFTLTRYDLALPLLGIGFALARAPLRHCVAGVGFFALGISLGGFVSDWIAILLSSHPGLIGYVFLTGPVCCVIVGICLAVPARAGALVAPPAALLMGIVLGLIVNFNDPSIAQWSFAGGAVLAGVLLVLPPLLTWRQFARPWFSIPGRIFGSWLIAVGSMLAAGQLIPRPLPSAEPPLVVHSPADLGAPTGIEPPANVPQPEPANPLGLPDRSQ